MGCDFNLSPQSDRSSLGRQSDGLFLFVRLRRCFVGDRILAVPGTYGFYHSYFVEFQLIISFGKTVAARFFPLRLSGSLRFSPVSFQKLHRLAREEVFSRQGRHGTGHQACET